MYMNGTGMIMMLWMGLLTLAIVAAGIAVAVWLARSYGSAAPSSGSVGHLSEAESVLRLRYAAGEIDDEEYRRRLAVLRGEQTP